jgi:hypothetical protein
VIRATLSFSCRSIIFLLSFVSFGSLLMRGVSSMSGEG